MGKMILALGMAMALFTASLVAQTGGLVGMGAFATQGAFVEIDTRNAVSVVIVVTSTDWTGDTVTIEACANAEETNQCSWFAVAGTTLGATPAAATTLTANGQVRVTNYGYRALRVIGTTVDGSPVIRVWAYRGMGA